MIELMLNQTANGDSRTSVMPTNQNSTVHISGVWNTATATIYLSPLGKNLWVAATNGVFTANTVKDMALNNELELKITLSSVGASTSLTAYLL